MTLRKITVDNSVTNVCKTTISQIESASKGRGVKTNTRKKNDSHSKFSKSKKKSLKTLPAKDLNSLN